MNMAKMKWVCELFADNLFLSIRNPKETNWKFLSLTKKNSAKQLQSMLKRRRLMVFHGLFEVVQDGSIMEVLCIEN